MRLYDLSIELPTETIEGLFCDFDDDHAAVPSAASQYQAQWTAQNIKGHNDMIDAFVEYKTPADRIREYNANKRSQGYRACADMNMKRRKRYAHREDPRCIRDTFIQRFIDA
jgi:hypothetical protein